MVEAEISDWSRLWQTAHERLDCQIIQNNFDLPPWRILGNHDSRHPAGFSRYTALVNLALEDFAPPYVTIHDIDHLAAMWGRWSWGDERFYHHAKLACSPEHLVDYAHSLASLVLAQLGHRQEVPGSQPGQHALGRCDRRRWIGWHQVGTG